jgi:hypothetical protein
MKLQFFICDKTQSVYTVTNLHIYFRKPMLCAPNPIANASKMDNHSIVRPINKSVATENPEDLIMVNRAQSEQSERVSGCR